MTVQLTADPLAIEVIGDGPRARRRTGSARARPRPGPGATRFGVFLSVRDDDPFGGGGLVCSWAEGEDGCTGTAIPGFAPSYNRLSVLAIVDETTEPDALRRRRPPGPHAELRPAAPGGAIRETRARGDGP